MSDEKTMPPARRETDDVGLRFMVWLLAGIGTVLASMLLLAWAIYPQAIHDQKFAQPFPIFPDPKLQSDPPADMRAFLQSEMQYLNGSGWIDREKGRVHMPIAHAMQDVARDGIADWPKP